MTADVKDWRPVTVQVPVVALYKAAGPRACARQTLSWTSRPGRYDGTRELHTPRQVQNATGSVPRCRGINDKQ
jgi:hypothetical protein